MADEDRRYTVRSLLVDYVKSPSLRHMRDPHFLTKLAAEIVNAVDRTSSVWRKWDGNREPILRAAARCWIPLEDLQAFLNNLPGPQLTATDVKQRLRALHEEAFARYPSEEVHQGCLAIYEREVALGTEMPAIIGALQEFVEEEEERLRIETERKWRERVKAEEEDLVQRLRSGADCKWVSFGQPAELFRRLNGRLYKLTQSKDKRWSLFRVGSTEEVKGVLLGQYLQRGDANKALAQTAFQPEPRF